MQSLSVKKGTLKSRVVIPTSKSYANRALILAVLRRDPTRIYNLPTASDVAYLIECLTQIGISFSHEEHCTTVVSQFPDLEKENVILDVGEGGTTARFLAALLLLGEKKYTLHLGKRLAQRPWKEFVDLATNLGGKASLSGTSLYIQGPIKFPASLDVDCARTTQFATAFQLIAPEGSAVNPRNLSSSQSYWKMTEKIIRDISNGDYHVPQDWSSASYPLAFAGLNHEIFFDGLIKDEYQADSKFLEILKLFSEVEESDSGIRVKPRSSEGSVQYDVSDCLDLVPALSFYLSHIKGSHKLSGIENLVHKESDRLNEVIKLLKLFNKSATTWNNELIINGDHSLLSSPVDIIAPDDHRMVMTGSLFLLHHAGGTISPAEAVNKSYPDFFGLLHD